MEIIRKVKSEATVAQLVEEIRAGVHTDKYQVGDVLTIGGIAHVIIGMDVEEGLSHSMTIQRHDHVKDHVFSENGRNDYSKSDVRAYLNGDYAEDLPEDFVAVVTPIKIDGMDGEEKFFLLSSADLDLESSKYPYYHKCENRTRYNEDGFAAWWWLRDPVIGISYSARNVGTTGYIYNYYYALNSLGLAPVCVIS